MPPKIYNIDVRSVDRDRARYPNSEDCVVDLGQTYRNVISLKLGSLEVPNTRYTVEEPENNMYFDEGFSIGTETMEQPFNALHDETRNTDIVVPATLMPIVSFDGVLMKLRSRTDSKTT